MVLRLSVDATSVEITGASEDELEEIDTVLKFRRARYNFTKAFKGGRWDGYTHILYPSRDGSACFSPGVLYRVLRYLDKSGIEYEIYEDLRPTHPKKEFGPAPYTPRYFQEEALDLIARHKRGIIQAPPRAGKTLITVELFRRTSLSPFIFLVWKREEAKQARRSFEERLPGLRAGIIADGVCDIEDKHVIIATVASLAWAHDLVVVDESKRRRRTRSIKEREDPLEEKRPRYNDYQRIKSICRTAKVVIWDEAHHAATDIDRVLAQKFRNAEYVVGLSGTPWRDDDSDILLEETVGPLIFQMPYSEAIEAGIILPLYVTAFYLPDFDYIIQKGYAEAYRKAISNNPWYDRFIKRLVEYHHKRGETVAIIVNQIGHGKRLNALIPGSRFAYGQSTNEARRRAFQGIAKRDGTCLISNLIDEAIDLPSLDVAIVADVRKGSTKVYQRIRSMTVDVGKDIAQLVCFVPSVPGIREHGVRALNLLRAEESFTIHAREVDEHGRIGPPKRLRPDRRCVRKGKLAVLPGATEGERRAARASGGAGGGGSSPTGGTGSSQDSTSQEKG